MSSTYHKRKIEMEEAKKFLKGEGIILNDIHSTSETNEKDFWAEILTKFAKQKCMQQRQILAKEVWRINGGGKTVYNYFANFSEPKF